MPYNDKYGETKKNAEKLQFALIVTHFKEEQNNNWQKLHPYSFKLGEMLLLCKICQVRTVT